MSVDTSFLFQNAAPRAISREELADLPIRRYEGEVCVINDEAELETAQRDLLEESVVGLDTESRPSFSRGESYLPSLVQVATARRVYLFQLSCKPVFAVLTAVLEKRDIVKAGVALAYDLRSLQPVFAFESENVVDLGKVARRCGWMQTGLRNLAGIFLDVRIPKGARTSNWAASRLTQQQINYAATDAWVCRELFLRFEALGMLDTGVSGGHAAEAGS